MAIVFAHVVQFNPDAGDQENAPLPLATRDAFPPGQVVTSAPAFTVGEELT